MPIAMGPLPSTSGRDRTSEFHAILDRLRKTQGSTLPPTNGVNGLTMNGHADETNRLLPRATGALQSEFNIRASQIGLSIHQTSQKLSKLAKLAKKTSMFDDPAVEIQELTSVVKQDITALNAALSDLQIICDSRNDRANQSKQSTEHSATVVDTLKSRLMNTTKEFKDILTLRTESLKVHDNRRQLFTASPIKQVNSYAQQGHLASAVPSSASSTSTSHPPWSNVAGRSNELFSSRRRPTADVLESSQSQGRLQQQQQLVPVQDSYMQNRAEALQNVESTIVELSSIFTQLATMVAQQGEVAIRIDENMDESLSNVEGAQTHLLKYLDSISSNRWLILKIFIVLIAFLSIFVVFVA